MLIEFTDELQQAEIKSETDFLNKYLEPENKATDIDNAGKTNKIE